VLAGAPPQTPLGNVQNSPDPLAGFGGSSGEGMEREGEGRSTPEQKFWLPP